MDIAGSFPDLSETPQPVESLVREIGEMISGIYFADGLRVTSRGTSVLLTKLARDQENKWIP